MWIKLFIACISICCINVYVNAQVDWDIWNYDISDEERLAYWQERYEDMSELAEHPVNINAATKEELEQLPFLSDRMIENILYYVYKYGPVLSKNELLGVEGMDRVTKSLLESFIYIGPTSDKRDKLDWKHILRYNKQELLTRVDIPLNIKAGYAEYPEEILAESPNKKYIGSRFYHNVKYRFRYKQLIFMGITAEKDAGEPFFAKYNRKGYDSYTGYFFMRNIGRIKSLAIGNYRADFGYGLVMNNGGFGFGKSGLESMQRLGKGFSKYTSTGEGNYLQGIGGSIRLGKRWCISGGYSYRKRDARVEDMFIRSLKTDGYHRLIKDLEKKNTINNHLIVSDLSFNGKYLEYGLTAVYNCFDKVLNPDFREYNRYYPRGKQFFNIGGHYKLFFRHFIFSGETAFDKNGRIATLNMLSYSPNVNHTFLLINRFYDKRYQTLSGEAFGENSRIQNEIGIYLGLESSILGRIKCSGYMDLFHFFYRRYLVDKNHTSGMDGYIQAAYQHNNSLSMLIKYGYKQKARNYTLEDKSKSVLPAIRQRIQGQFIYTPHEKLSFKTCAEFVQNAFYRYERSRGGYISETGKVKFARLPLELVASETWFCTQDYNSRVYVYEPGLLYTFSVPSFYGKGNRLTIRMKYTYKEKWMIQAKWGWTRYYDRDKISKGPEEILGRDKADIQIQLRMKW